MLEQIARANGTPKVSAQVEKRIRKLRAEGKGILLTAKLAGCGVLVVLRVIKEDAAAAA